MAPRATTATTATRRRTPAAASEGHLDRIRRVLRERWRVDPARDADLWRRRDLLGNLSENSYDVTATVGVSNLDRSAAVDRRRPCFPTAEPGAAARRVEHVASLPEVQLDAAPPPSPQTTRTPRAASLFAAAVAPGLVRVGRSPPRSRRGQPRRPGARARRSWPASTRIRRGDRPPDRGSPPRAAHPRRRARATTSTAACRRSVIDRNLALLEALERHRAGRRASSRRPSRPTVQHSFPTRGWARSRRSGSCWR